MRSSGRCFCCVLLAHIPAIRSPMVVRSYSGCSASNCVTSDSFHILASRLFTESLGPSALCGVPRLYRAEISYTWTNNSQYSCFLWTLSAYPRQVCPPVAGPEEGDQSDLLYGCLADSFPLVRHSFGRNLETSDMEFWEMGHYLYLYFVYCWCVSSVNDTQLHFWSVGWWEKRKPKQGTVVNQIFTEAKRVV